MPIPTAATFPERMEDLTETEQLIARSYRRWIAGLAEGNGSHWAMVWNEFAGRMGSDVGRAALGGLEAMIRTISMNACRTVRYSRPCCPFVDADESRVIALVGACQRGDLPAARQLAETLVDDNGVGDLLGAGARFAQALGRQGRTLPCRRSSLPVDSFADIRTPPVGTLVH